MKINEDIPINFNQDTGPSAHREVYTATPEMRTHLLIVQTIPKDIQNRGCLGVHT